MRQIFTIIPLMFFSFLQAQNVNLAWAKNIGSTSSDIGRSITVDAAGNVYATGIFQGTVDFDPGAGTNDLTSSDGDIFITKSDPSGNLIWAKNMGGVNASTSIAVDALGNVYITGSFKGAADFDPGPGIFNLTSAGDEDIFITKLDATGSFVWAKKMGGPLFDFGAAIAVDAAGNVYTTGDFIGSADFDPGPNTHILTYGGSLDVFISKLDAAGNFVWAVNIGSASGAFGISITVDPSGNVYTTGDFTGTTDFDPGPGTYNLSATGTGSNIFISKLDGSGNFVWAKSMGSNTTGGGAGYSIALDASGNVYTTGFFEGVTDFDPGAGEFNLTSVSEFADVFVSKLDASGNFIWAKSMGGAAEGFGNSIAVNTSGVYIAGDFQGTVDFDPGSGTNNLTSAGGRDIFVAKLDISGNFVWAKNIGGASDDVGQSIATDASGSIYTTGYFQGTADFDPGAAVFNLTSAGQTDIFIAKFSQPSADLELTKTASKMSITVGETETYTVTLSNKGPDSATGVRVTDVAPAGMSFGQVTPSSGTYDKNTGTWSPGALGNGDKATLTIVATATQAGTITNTAEVTASDQHDPDSSPGNGVAGEDDQSSVSIQVTNAVSVEAQILQLIHQVNSLVQQNQLSIRHGRILTGLLYASLDLYKHGFAGASIFTLRTFILSVRALVRNHQLSAENGQSLILAAQNIIKLIESEQKHLQNSVDKTITINKEDNLSNYKLYPNYPNPFHSATVISFDLPKESRTQLTIYTTEGKIVAKLLDDVMPAGKHSITWQPKDLPAGIYLLRFQAGTYIQTERMVLVK